MSAAAGAQPAGTSSSFPLDRNQLAILVDEELRGPRTRAYAIAAGWVIEPAPRAEDVIEALRHAVRALPILQSHAVAHHDGGWHGVRTADRNIDVRSWDGDWCASGDAADHLATAARRDGTGPLPALYATTGGQGRLLVGFDHVFVDGLSMPAIDRAIADGLGADATRPASPRPVAGGPPTSVVLERRLVPREVVTGLRRRARSAQLSPFALLGAVIGRVEARLRAAALGVAVVGEPPTPGGEPRAVVLRVPLPPADDSAAAETAARTFSERLASARLESAGGQSQQEWSVLVEEPRRATLTARAGASLTPGPVVPLGRRYRRLWTWRQVDADVELSLEQEAGAARPGLLDEVLDALASLAAGEEPPARAADVVAWGKPAPRDSLDVTARIERWARHAPDAVAVEAPDETLSYGQLWARAQDLAGQLSQRTSAGEPVLVLTGRSASNAVALVGILLADRTYVPFDPARFGPGSDVEVARAGGARWLLHPEAGSLTEIAGGGDGDGQPPDRRDEPAYVLFTSGSTGRPKPAWVGRRTLSNLIDWQVDRSDADPGWRTLQYAAGTFDVSLQEMLSTLASGGALIVPGESLRRDPWELLRFVRERDVHRIFVPYVVLEQLAAAAAHQPEPTGLREIVTAGEALHVTATLRTWLAREPGVVLDNQYGPTETHVVTAHRLTGDPEGWPAVPPIGTPVQAAGILVLDDADRPIPLDDAERIGELCVVGTPVGLGYGGDVRGGFTSLDVPGTGAMPAYRTGDLARWSGGCLEYVGRRDDQVKINGIRLQLTEVEARLRELPDVREAAAVTIGTGAARRLAAFVVAAGGVTGPAVRRAFAATAPAHMVPSVVVLLETLPVNEHGKVDRKALAATLESSSDEAADAPPADTGDDDLASAVTAAWTTALGEPPEAADASFFDAGGDSLAAVRMLGALRTATGRHVPLRRFVAQPTPAALARALATASDLDPSPTGTGTG